MAVLIVPLRVERAVEHPVVVSALSRPPVKYDLASRNGNIKMATTCEWAQLCATTRCGKDLQAITRDGSKWPLEPVLARFGNIKMATGRGYQAVNAVSVRFEAHSAHKRTGRKSGPYPPD